MSGAIAFRVGQRWVSNNEGELGLGIVRDSSGRTLEMYFPAADAHRFYAADNAPLSRVVYAAGDQLRTDDGRSFIVEYVHEINGCFVYQGETPEHAPISIHEMDLDSRVHFSQPQDRLYAGQIDRNKAFELRIKALTHQHRALVSRAFGLLGPRVQLLPHQLYIAHEVSQRHAPRVLLADEVGLGKTIEAGLILHRQLLAGAVERVLIVVPDNLLHQWLVEMLRRFNLAFSLIDSERYAALADEGGNPFDSAQLVLCGLQTLLADAAMRRDLLAAGWDLLVVDEAHHLYWQPDAPSEAYSLIETLAARIAAVLLLTATPEQLGIDSHFARLRLLDPERYFDLQHFREEQAGYHPIEAMISQLESDNAFEDLRDPAVREKLAQWLDASLLERLATADSFVPARDAAVRALLDRHGTGRVLFRNTRAVVRGFPQRILCRYPQTLPADSALDADAPWSPSASFGADWTERDTRVHWLIDWLAQHRHHKALLICSHVDSVIELEACLRLRHGVRSAVFHENMSLVNRDRAAAYFADEEGGAQILLCSEIGSEGRNFQFCQHLLLFDLPDNPDLLEQRIGRLDRIGQQRAIYIHVPYYPASAQQVWLDWYHAGMNAFERVVDAGDALRASTSELLQQALASPQDDERRQALIAGTRAATETCLQRLHSGRNQLLERHSFDAAVAGELLAELEAASRPLELADFMDEVFDVFGVEQQSHGPDSIIVEPGNHMLHASFPALPEDGLTATFQRQRALSREDMAFLNWEHPMVMGAIDLIVNSELGNTAFCTLDYPALAPGALVLEAVFILNCAADRQLQIQRYLPQRYLRLVVDESGAMHQAQLPAETFNRLAGRIPRSTAQQLVQHARPRIAALVETARMQACAHEPALVDQARQQMRSELQPELERLNALAAINPAIRPDEITQLSQRQRDVDEVLHSASLVLDAIRLAIVPAGS